MYGEEQIKVDGEMGHVSDLPDYPVHPLSKEKLVEYGFDQWIAAAERTCFEVDGHYAVMWGWKEGRYMIAWDAQQRCWSIRNFAVCKN